MLFEFSRRSCFINSLDGDTNSTKLLPLTNQTKLILTLNPKTKLTLEHGINPTKP